MEIFRLKKGDFLVKKLESLVNSKKEYGCLFGLGALESATLKLYDLSQKKYYRKTIRGSLEVGSFTAIIASLNNKMIIHPHVVVSDSKFNCYCGHLEEGIVSATFEVIYIESKKEIKRVFDKSIGLNLLINKEE